jgi:hypothetical protein
MNTERETMRGFVEIPVTQSIVEINKQTDDTNTTSMDVVVNFDIEKESFRYSGCLEADDSVIDDVSKTSYPRNVSSLTAKTIDKLIVAESEDLSHKRAAQKDLITKRAIHRTRAGIAAGFMTGGLFALTISDVVENGVDDGNIIGLLVTVCMGAGAYVIGDKNQPELTSILADDEIVRSYKRLNILSILRRASNGGRIKNVQEVENT